MIFSGINIFFFSSTINDPKSELFIIYFFLIYKKRLCRYSASTLCTQCVCYASTVATTVLSCVLFFFFFFDLVCFVLFVFLSFHSSFGLVNRYCSYSTYSFFFFPPKYLCELVYILLY